jgi:hypothetical protein
MADEATGVTETAGVVVRTVRIPGSDDHAGWYATAVTLLWECPRCGGPRGEVEAAVSYDGSRRLGCDGWSNPCGHVDGYAALRREAGIRP